MKFTLGLSLAYSSSFFFLHLYVELQTFLDLILTLKYSFNLDRNFFKVILVLGLQLLIEDFGFIYIFVNIIHQFFLIYHFAAAELVLNLIQALDYVFLRELAFIREGDFSSFLSMWFID